MYMMFCSIILCLVVNSDSESDLDFGFSGLDYVTAVDLRHIS